MLRKTRQPDLNLHELICGDVIRMRHVKRFSACRVLAPENIAEHSFFVAWFALHLCYYLRQAGVSVVISTVLEKALLHDFEEVWTGDLPRYVKHGDDQISHAVKEALDISSEEAVVRLLGRISPASEVYGFRAWKLAKDDTLEGRIIEVCDFLAVLSYIIQEIRAANRTMLEHLYGIQDYYNKVRDDPAYKQYFDEVFRQCEPMMKELEAYEF